MTYDSKKCEPKPARAEPERTEEITDVVDWVRTRLKIDPDEMQERVLRSEARRGILNCTRQWGKSTIAAAKAVHRAFVHGGSLTVVISPSARQSAEFVRKAAGFVGKLGLRPKGDGDNDISLAFPNRSRIVGLPGKEATIRGFSAVSLMIVDEASRVSDELYMSIRPMLMASGGALWLMSTPYGKRGFFYEAWAKGGPEWERIRVQATDCPRFHPKQLQQDRRDMGDRWFRQEYLCEFVDSVSGVFERELVEGAITSKVKPLVLR